MRYLSPKYVAVLALIAAAILGIGSFLRPVKARQAQPSSDSGATPLQRISREAEMRETADFLSQRMRQTQKYVVYLPDLHASAIAWDGQSTLVTTDNIDSSTGPARLSLMARHDPNDRHLEPVAVSPGLRQETEWAALVARRPDGELVWSAGLAGGSSQEACAGIEYHEVAFNAPVTAGFAGGGLFDLNGGLIGVVSRCGDKLTLVAASEVASLLKMTDSLDEKLRLRYGMRVIPFDEALRQYFEVFAGLLVTEVWTGGLADRAGLQPGDVILGLNDEPVTELRSLAGLVAPASTGDLRFEIQRSGKPMALKLVQPGTVAPPAGQEQASAGLDAEPPLRGVALSNVAPRSPGYNAGLRPGDRVWQVGTTRVNARDALNHALAAAGQDPVFILFDRGSVQHGVLLASGKAAR